MFIMVHLTLTPVSYFFIISFLTRLWCFFLRMQRSSTYSFNGCVKNLQLDGKLLLAAESFGVTPCFEGPSEEGTYFSMEGGYVVLG